MASPCAACRFATCKFPNLKKKIIGPPPAKSWGRPCIIWKLLFRTHINLLHTINNCYPIEFILEKRCIKFLHFCLSSDNLVISNVAKSSCDNCYSTFGDNVRYFSHKYNIASKKWMEPFTDLLPCLFDNSSTPDLPVAHTIRELALCRDDNSTFLLTSVEMSQIIEYLCTI